MEEKYKIKINDYVCSNYNEILQAFIDIDKNKINKIVDFMFNNKINQIISSDYTYSIDYEVHGIESVITLINSCCIANRYIFIELYEDTAFLFELKFS